MKTHKIGLKTLIEKKKKSNRNHERCNEYKSNQGVSTHTQLSLIFHPIRMLLIFGCLSTCLHIFFNFSFYSSLPALFELIRTGDKEQLEDLLCQVYPVGHLPYTHQEAQEALHFLTGQADCDKEILQWLLDAGVSPNEPCCTDNNSVLHKAAIARNVTTVKVRLRLNEKNNLKPIIYYLNQPKIK